jgi:CelD/BcsL family acetyltransferase involved in cellulose biosynthesis
LIVELELCDPRWRDLVEHHPSADAFNHPAWAETVASPYGFRVFVAARLKDNAVAAGMPVVEVRAPLRAPRWISLPFTDRCVPLARDRTALEALTCDLDVARREAGVASVEVRAELPAPARPLSAHAVVHRLALGTSAEQTAALFRRSHVLRNVRKAEREGVQVRIATEERDVTETYYRLHVATRRRQGVPVQPRRFFKQIWRRMLAPGLGFCLLAEVGGRTIAAAVFLAWNRTVTYKFGASDPRAWQLRPNNLIFWEAIRIGCDQRRTLLDFGRTNAENQGLREFKSNWGANETVLEYAVVGASPNERRARLVKLAEPVIRRSPRTVCRLAGELFYRFAA